MDYFECIQKRFSCRSFKEEKVSKEILEGVLQAGLLAPTACNYQPERIVVVEDPSIIERLKEATRYTFNAKTILIVCHDKNESWHRGNDGVDHGIVDSTIVATQMVLALTSLGLASCYVCSFKEKLAREILGLSDHLNIDIMLPIGYPREVLPHNKRKDLDSIVIYK